MIVSTILEKELASGGSKISDYTREEIDKEIKDLVDFCYKAALNIIEKNKNIFHIMTKELLDKKTLSTQKILKISRIILLNNDILKMFKKITLCFCINTKSYQKIILILKIQDHY